MWRPRGERGLSSCRSCFITLARASPRRSGLRSRGAGSPMTNVPVSRQQALPGPATPSAQQAPRERLPVSLSDKELLKAQTLLKGDPVPAPGLQRQREKLVSGGGAARSARGDAAPSEFVVAESATNAARLLLPNLTWTPPRPLAPRPSLNWAWGWAGLLGGDSEAAPAGTRCQLPPPS